LENWIVENSQFIVDDKWMRVRRDTCRLPTGKQIDYYLWIGDDFSMVFGLTEDDRVLLVRQYKHGARDIVVELPAGVVEQNDSDPQVAAARELREETGYEAQSYISLGSVFIASAKAPTVANLYLATGLTRVASPVSDDQEVIECSCVSVSELINMIVKGEIRDVNSIATTFLALRRLGRLEIRLHGE